MEEKIFQLEHAMWGAVLHRDVQSFCGLVSPDAVMVCGGYRCLGREYAGFIKDFYISGYSIQDMEVISSREDEILLHYIIRIEVENAASKDLEGLFHVASQWKRNGDAWSLCFNMDSRIVTR